MSSIERVKQALDANGLACEICYLEESAHTAQQAADALGCAVAQIVKSLVFRAVPSQTPILALVSGNKRLDTGKLATLTGAELGKADATFVKVSTGFTIGGVAPLGSIHALPVYMDATLLDHDRVWAAAGHPKTVFEVNPAELANASGAIIAELT